MLGDYIEIKESKLPPLTDPRCEEYGLELGREFDSFDKPRQVLAKEIWPICDRAFMAIRDEMPYIPTMKLLDNGMVGDPGIRNNLKDARNMLLEATFPTNEAWLELASMNDEDDEASLESSKNFLINRFQESGVRRSAQITYDQLFARGTTAMGLKWETLFRIERMAKSLAGGLAEIAEALELADEDGLPLGGQEQTLIWKKIFDGPLVYPVDMQRLWLDPTCDIGGRDREQSYIHLTFKTIHDLKYAKDRETGKNLYNLKVLEEVDEITYEEFYKQNPEQCDTTKLMGIDPGLQDMGKFIPVYIFYRQIRVFEDGEIFIDKFFYCARSKGGWRIIRVQNNPSSRGVKPFYVTCLDPYLGTPYGVPMAEKALSAWKSKNIIDAIGLNTKVIHAANPMFYVSGVLKDDRKPKLTPFAMQEIMHRPGIGLEWIKPFPLAQNDVQIGMIESRYYGEQITAGTGMSSAQTTTDPTRNLSKEKTATEVKSVEAQGTAGIQVIADITNEEMVQPLANGMHDLCREHYTEDQRYISETVEGKPLSEKIEAATFNRDRAVRVMGRRGLANRGSAVQSLTEVLKLLANPQAAGVIQNLPLLLQDVLFKVCSKLGVPIKDEYRMQPGEIFAKIPGVEMAAVQNALQNPEMREQIGQMLMQSPEGMQIIEQIKQQAVQEHMATQQKPASGAKP